MHEMTRTAAARRGIPDRRRDYRGRRRERRIGLDGPSRTAATAQAGARLRG